MRKPNVTKWDNSPDLDGLLIFAQSLDELLFDYTVDSFKASALNLHLSIMEVRALLIQLINERIRTNSILYAMQELEYHFKNDPVIPRPVPALWAECLERLKNLETRPQKLLDLADSLLMEIDTVYWTLLKDKIIAAVSDSHKKDKIIALTKVLAAEIEIRGFSRRFAYFANKRFFFTTSAAPSRISRQDQLGDFLNLFEVEPRENDVIFRGTADLIQFNDFSKSFGITIQSDPPSFSGSGFRVQNFTGNADNLPLFFIVHEVIAKDVQEACRRAKSQGEFFIDVCRFANHTSELGISSASLVIDEKNTNCDVIKAPPNPMTCNYRQSDYEEHSIIKQSIEILRGRHFSPELLARFTKVIEYHEAALTAKTPENQLLNLWAALEGFLPPPDEKIVRINYYLSILLPVLTMTYIHKIFNYVADSLKSHGEPVRQLIEQISSDGSFLGKTIALLTCEEFEAKRKELCDLLLDYRLLLNRCYWCFTNFSSSSKIRSILEAHRKKVTWHIKRVYTTRNLISHSSQSLPYLNTLVENLHSYLDTLVDYVIIAGIHARYQAPLGGILTLCSLHENTLLKSLEGDDRKCSLGNYKALLLGSKSFFDRMIK